MRFYFVLMLIPGKQVREFVHGGDQKSVGVKIVIDGDAVPLATKGMAVIAEL